VDDLFALPPSSGIRLDMTDAEVVFYAHVLTPSEASEVFSVLQAETQWRAEKVFVWGKWHEQPRRVAWYGDAGTEYTYSGSRLQPTEWTATLRQLREKIEALSGSQFNSVLLNYYRNEKDHMGWHSDNEPELGDSPTIASLSLGAARVFQFKRKDKKGGVNSVELTSGSVIVMSGATQRHWVHCIRKETRMHDPRINLTFRQIRRRK